MRATSSEARGPWVLSLHAWQAQMQHELEGQKQAKAESKAGSGFRRAQAHSGLLKERLDNQGTGQE